MHDVLRSGYGLGVSDRPDRLRGRAAFRIHVGLVLCLVICIGIGTFELTRALGGNLLSWAYVVEWPILAGFGIFMWWRLLNGEPVRKPPTSAKAIARQAVDDQDLAAWNAYLADLHGNGPDAEAPPTG
jgi:hypothetical protein